jgi:HlyD family secretion protein
MEDPLPPIPIPLALRWREFRIRVLPILFFLAAVAGVCFVWRQNIAAPTLVGAVETRSAQIISPYEGKITQLSVGRFQRVTKGTVIAVLVPNDPRAALDVIQSELSILNARLGTPLDEQRGEISFERLRESWLAQKVDLAGAQVNLELARDEVQRVEKLFAQKLVSESTNDAVIKTEQALEAGVAERSNLVVAIEAGMNQIKSASATPDFSGDTNSPLAKALDIEEQKLADAAAGTKPVTLTAPMDGMVSVVFRQDGEIVAAGSPVVTLSAVEPEHIIGYLRQPIPFEPKAGMKVEVRTRAMRIQSGMAQIQTVGSQFETVTNSLAIVRPDKSVDLGLPVELSLPAGLKLRPGEIVDLTLRSKN